MNSTIYGAYLRALRGDEHLMGKDKDLEKIRRNPNDVTFDRLESILIRYGFKVRNGKGSHAIVSHPDIEESFPVPRHKPIKPIYIKRCIKMIDFVLAEENEK